MFRINPYALLAVLGVFILANLLGFLIRIFYSGDQRESRENATPHSPQAEWASRYDQYLVYQCTEPSQCRSWTDLQKGVVTAYVMADMMKRHFAVRVTYPCRNLTRLVEKHFLNVNDEAGAMLNRSTSTKEILLSRRVAGGLADELSSLDFNAAFPEDFLIVMADDGYVKELRQNKKYAPRSRILKHVTSHEEVYKFLTPYLFKPHKPFLTQDLATKQFAICAHVNIGTEEKCLDEDVVNRLFSLLMKRAPNGYIYFSTDDKQLEERARSALCHKSLVLKGPELWHLRNDEGGVCDEFEEDMIDQEILKKCRALVITLSTTEMGFYAHFFQEEAEMFCMTGKSLVPCSVENALTYLNSSQKYYI